MKFRPLLVPVVLLGWPALGTAQSGTVRYDQSTRFDFNVPANSPMAGRMPRAFTKQMQLTYSKDATLFAEAPSDGRGEGRGFRGMGGGMGGGVSFEPSGGGRMDVMVIEGSSMAFARAGWGGGGRSDAVTGAYTNLLTGDYIEVRQFLGRTFRIPEPRPSFAWKLTGEQASFLGHPVFQARAQQDSTRLEAWFAPDIPISAGPAQYGGLPGLILTLAVDSNRIVYSATAIDTTTAVSRIKAPSDGSKVSREEYEKIVKEKTEEMAKSRRGRGN